MTTTGTLESEQASELLEGEAFQYVRMIEEQFKGTVHERLRRALDLQLALKKLFNAMGEHFSLFPFRFPRFCHIREKHFRNDIAISTYRHRFVLLGLGCWRVRL